MSAGFAIGLLFLSIPMICVVATLVVIAWCYAKRPDAGFWARIDEADRAVLKEWIRRGGLGPAVAASLPDADRTRVEGARRRTAILKGTLVASNTVLLLGSAAAVGYCAGVEAGKSNAALRALQTPSSTASAAAPILVGLHLEDGRMVALVVRSVYPESRYARAGIREGDRIESVAGIRPTSPRAATETMIELVRSREKRIVIRRESAPDPLHLTLEAGAGTSSPCPPEREDRFC